MHMKKSFRLYNILFPVWLLIWIPSWLWLILIPANYLIDLLISWLSMRQLGVEDPGRTARRHSVGICILGFISDFIGAAFLLGLMFLEPIIKHPILDDILLGIGGFKLYDHPAAVITVIVSILLSGICIYFFDKALLKRDPSLTTKQVKAIALNMAIFTAPYLFLIPSNWIYN